jgi:hypothetical protein
MYTSFSSGNLFIPWYLETFVIRANKATLKVFASRRLLTAHFISLVECLYQLFREPLQPTTNSRLYNAFPRPLTSGDNLKAEACSVTRCWNKTEQFEEMKRRPRGRRPELAAQTVELLAQRMSAHGPSQWHCSTGCKLTRV